MTKLLTLEDSFNQGWVYCDVAPNKRDGFLTVNHRFYLLVRLRSMSVPSSLLGLD